MESSKKGPENEKTIVQNFDDEKVMENGKLQKTI